MTTYETRISKSQGDDKWHWCIVRHEHTSGLESVACMGDEEVIQQVENSSEAAIERLKKQDDMAMIGYPTVCVTCGN